MTSMSDVPASVIAELNALDGYEKMLAIDRVTVEHGVSSEELMRLMEMASSGTTLPASEPEWDMSISRSKGGVDPMMETSSSPSPGAEALSEAHRYRMGYDPSNEGRMRQSQVEQAIVCPACRSPLGIPSVRPIKVTCPQCMTETLFES